MTLEATPAPSEQKLLERLLAGEEQAYEELVRSYGGRMLAVARRFLPVEEDARDAVQDAFLSAFRSIHRFEGNARLSTWLHRIVVNAALMKLRTRRRHPEQSIDDLLPGYLEDGHFERPASPWRTDGLDPAEEHELRELVLRSIHSLPEGHRNVLLLRDIEGLDTEEAADLLQISPGAVKTRLHRARQALRELLEPHLRERSAS
ncbi:MAG TPA: sigma-70 family RNA polymerase sigma factor [Myxococcota bacterium]|nr:sigma-70 family RNA polymerase sigma factor [Myxococcota bacterium]